jgi:diaminohydroxyphosphoribosylaminopyrimidine deaminase/5-amino-6-(5-phosphoribosylamino)uracil reductase
MGAALRKARAARGRVFPNPPVGAVVYRGSRILGRGCTQPPGSDHAEVVALDAARRRHGARALRGASLAVTLEPCCHTGRTGPCTAAILEAGIGHVVVGHRDPHPEVAGGGIRKLRRAGLRVSTGVLEERCREQHRGFLSVVERGRPFVTLKLAATLDGRIATRTGESRWITGPESRAFVHRLRDAVDAVMVGAGTAREDDPELSVRRAGKLVRRPVRVVADARLSVSPRSKLLAGNDGGAWWLCSRRAPASRRRALEVAGARLIDVPMKGRGLDLRKGLARLAEAGLCEILVEGGASLAASLLREGLVDELHWFLAPRLIGGDGVEALGQLGVSRLADAGILELERVGRMGPDLYLKARTRRGGERG